MDFAVLPPEVSSGRMYAGVGPGAMVTAAAAWGGLAAELSSTAASYQAVLSELTGGPWIGPSSTTMITAVAPYVSWMNVTAAQAEQTASQLESAVTAYEAAFAATVPPTEIEINRALLAALVATNVFGQNTSAIAILEAQYGEMWAQDAAAMYGYAGASAAATTLTPFTSPTQNTDPGGTAAQAAAVSQATASATGTGARAALPQAISTVPSVLQSLSSGGSSNPLTALENILTSPLGLAVNKFGSDFGNVSTEFSGFAFVASGITPFFSSLYPLALPAQAAAAATGSVAPGGAAAPNLLGSYGSGSGVSAGVGDAAKVGGLSVPESWATSPAIRLAATALPAAGPDGLPQAGIPGPGGVYGGIPPVGSLVNAPRGADSRAQSGTRRKVVAAMPGESDVAARGQGRPAQQERSLTQVASALSDNEREELASLRKEIAELATERDAAARLIKEAIL